MKNSIDIDNIAELAKISLSESEKEEMAKDMAEIVEFANQLAALDIEKISETAHVLPLENVLREDVPERGTDRAALLSNAKTKTEEYIYVPRVVE